MASATIGIVTLCLVSLASGNYTATHNTIYRYILPEIIEMVTSTVYKSPELDVAKGIF